LIEIYANYIKSPTSLISGRIFIDAKYLWPEELLVIMSSFGNQRIKEEYYSSHPDTQNTLTGNNEMSAHQFLPLYDSFEKDKIIGTKIFFINESDFGGSVPKWIT
jgi:hypothetical protein